MKNCESVQAGEQRPVTGWDKVHAVGIFILGIVAVVMVGNSLIDSHSSATLQAAQQPVAPKTTFTDAADNVTAKFGNQKTNLGWQTISTAAVPEPTSGLLLLLGVAGLAHTCSHFASQSSGYALG